MRALHFAESFSPVSETFIYDYVTELERQGVDNHVVTYARMNVEERPFPKVYVVNRPSRWHPLRLWHRALVPLGIGEPRTTDWPQTRARLDAVLQEVDPDVVHAHFGPAGVMVAPVAQKRDLPLVVTFYGYDISSLPEEKFWRSAYKDLWSQVNCVTVLSEEMEQRAENLGCPPDALSIVHLSRDLDNFPFRPPSHPVRNVLFVGRLVAKKAPIDAVRAVAEATQHGAGLYLDILGDGPLRTVVEEYVHDHNLSEQVTVHGQVPNGDVSRHMHDADAFLLPSRTAPCGDREGTPTVLVEAQAVGLPCVSTHHAGISEMIPRENHDLLAPEGDVETLSNCLFRLANFSADDLMQLAETGRRKVEREFNLSREVESLRDTYSRAVYSKSLN